jgi:flagella basal body P-ring formation protein FlgA
MTLMIRPLIALSAMLLATAAAAAPAKVERVSVPVAALPSEPVSAASVAPRRLQLRAELTLARDFVTYGDLFAGAPADLSNAPAFRAPALGETGTIQVARIVEAARAAGLVGDLDTQGLAQVVVTRAARRLMASDLDAAVKTGLQERFGVDARAFALSIDGGAPALAIEPELTGEAVVVDLGYDARSRRVQARLMVPGSTAMRLKPVRISGQLVETVEVVVPRRAIARGETLGKADLIVERRPRDAQTGEFIGDLRAAVDKVARRALFVGMPLRGGDVQREEIVAKGDLVTIVYEAPGLMITMRGRASDAGAMGDVVSVTNPQSKRVLQGTVSGPGRISVQASSAGRVASAN